MPDLGEDAAARNVGTDDAAKPATPDYLDAPTLWWCKRTDGTLVEHTTNSYTGHKGHVRCIPVGGPRG